jgi:NAD(P)-dependent dehydrogenase (short-subunit alcohol dehydrogenase family)
MTVALVTGGNKGVGLATVRGLARRGVRVWLGARSAALGERAADDGPSGCFLGPDGVTPW